MNWWFNAGGSGQFDAPANSGKSGLVVQTLMNYAKAYLLKWTYARERFTMTIKDDRPDRMIIEISLCGKKANYIYDKEDRADNIGELEQVFLDNFRNVR
jgi:hypothetical protein